MLVPCALLHDRPELVRRIVVAVLLVSLGLHASAQPYRMRVCDISKAKTFGKLYVPAMLSCISCAALAMSTPWT